MIKIYARQKKPAGYWTKERCHEEALKYKSRYEFEKNSGSACKAARKNKWMNEICSHMLYKIKPNNYWTKEKCYEEYLKYGKKLIEINRTVYEKCRTNNWLIEFKNNDEKICQID